jgi:hypothetical protein
MEYQKDFYASESGAQFPSGTPKKAVSGNGNTTSKGTFTPEIDFGKLYGAVTPAMDTQFIYAILPEGNSLPKAAPKNSGNSKSKKGY